MMLSIAEHVGQQFVNHGEHEFQVAPSRDDRIQVKVGDELIVLRVLYLEHRVKDISGVRLPDWPLTTVVVGERL